MTVKLFKSFRNINRNKLTSSSFLALSASILWKGLRDAVSSTFLSFSAFCRRCLQQILAGNGKAGKSKFLVRKSSFWRESQTTFGGKIKLLAGNEKGGKTKFYRNGGRIQTTVKNNSLGHLVCRELQ
jgi:hypothetical protein